MIKISPNLVDARYILTHTATFKHFRLNKAEQLNLGITPKLI